MKSIYQMRTWKSTVVALALLVGVSTPAADVLLEVFPFNWPLNTTNRMQTWNVPMGSGISDWGNVFMTKSNASLGAAEIAFQPCPTGGVWIADFVPQGVTNWYRLYSGHASTATPLITISTNSEYYQVTNSFLGARINRSTANLATQRASLQGARTKDGTWFSTNETAVTLGPWNYRHRSDLPSQDIRDTNRLTATNLITTVIESGPVVFQVRNVYEYTRPAYSYAGVATYPASYGYLTNTVTVFAEMPDVLFEDITNMELWYGLHIQDVLTPNRLRYRGHGADQAVFGYNEGNGTIYTQPNTGPNYDATRDIATNEDLIPQDFTQTAAPKRIIKMIPWNRFNNNSGWYEQAYATGGAGTSPLIGAFVGPASKARQMGTSGVSWYSKANTRWGFVVYYAHRGADNSFTTNHVSQWGIYIDQKANMPAYTAFQPIGLQQNLFAGFGLTKLSRYVLDFADRSDGYNHPFMSPSIMTNLLIGPIRNNINTYNYYYSAEPSARPILDYWRENANGASHASLPVTVFNLASNLFESLINGDGVFDNDNGGMRAGMAALDVLAYVDAILGDQWSTAAQKAQARSAGAALGYMLWDNDFTPLDIDTRVPLGTPNQILQYNANRNSFAFGFPNHTYFSDRVQFATNNVIELIQDAYNLYGAAAETPHYIEAAFGPLVQNCLQLQQTPGALDPFIAESQRLTNLARFYMQMITPIEPRFGNQYRKRVTWGDGSTESTWIPGALATGLMSVDTNLAAELLGAWYSMGKVHSDQFVTTILTINETGPTNTWTLPNEVFQGGMGVLHSGYGTTNESSFWLPQGPWYNDHRHQQDWGSAIMYALGAPLAIHPGPLYTPRVDRQQMQNGVSYESTYASPWNGSQPITSTTASGSFTTTATNNNFISFNTSGWVDTLSGDGAARTWRRSIRLLGANPELPVYIIKDTFSEDGISRVMTLQFASEANAITTPAGNYTVTVTDYPSLPPGNSTIVTLTNGVRQMTFTGGTWSQHPSQGINWIYAINTSENKFMSAGAWGNTWNNDREQGQYRTANSAGTYRERLTQLRIRGSNDFNHILVPYRKNAYVAGLTVSTNGSDWQISNTNQYWRISTNEWAYNRGTTRRVYALWEGLTGSDTNGIAVSGGPTEVDLQGTNTVLSFHGNVGKRTITLPANWRSNPPRLFSIGDPVVFYSGGTSARVTIQ